MQGSTQLITAYYSLIDLEKMKGDRVEASGRTDEGDCITCRINEVGNNAPRRRSHRQVSVVLCVGSGTVQSGGATSPLHLGVLTLF